MATGQITAVKVVKGNALKRGWIYPMQIIYVAKDDEVEEYIDTMEGQSFNLNGSRTPGINWEQYIGVDLKDVPHRVVEYGGLKWLKGV